MRFDLHVHTTLSSCSQLTLEEIMSFAGAKGLDGVCITDHDTMAVRQVFREGVQDNGLCVIFGLEYATEEGDFLLFGPFEEIRPGLAAAELLRYVEASGGVAVAAHPCRRSRSTRENLIREHLCRIVESVNGRNSHPENKQAASWCKRYNVSQVCGSDAHTLSELGMAVTRFHEPVHNRSDLIRLLKNGSFTAERNEDEGKPSLAPHLHAVTPARIDGL
ncbi:MAG: PHP domain-containing protein [Proteobacteria bacterium]|nr:PHP domain-containing protein [Pseudomonadota bacterium]